MILKISYLGLTILMMLIVSIVGFKTIDTTYIDRAEAKNKKLKLLAAILIWQLYIFVIALSGLLETYELPPRFPLYLIIPAFTFTGVFIYKNRNRAWIQNINPKYLIYVQSFRILVETIFVFSLAEGILHKNVTIEGYNMDMIFAFTAPIVGYFAFQKLSKKVLVLWNYLGLAVLASVIFAFMSSIYLPQLYGSLEPLIPMKAVRYPYILVAASLMPLAVFIHVLSIVQLRYQN